MAKAKTQTVKTCRVCTHPERLRIEQLRLAGSSADALADAFGIGRDSVYRHMAGHVGPDRRADLIADVPLRELAERAAAEGVSLLDYFGLVRKTVIEQMLAAAAVQDRRSTAALAGRATEVLSEIGRLTGELLSASSSVTNIINNTTIVHLPIFVQLQAMLLERLAPWPEALASVVAGLDELEASPSPDALHGLRGRPEPSLTAEAIHAA